MAQFLRHEPCPACGSSDALGRYDNGEGHCFSCNHNQKGSGKRMEEAPAKHRSPLINEGHFEALPNRNLTEETCQKWGYKVADLGGHRVEIATYRNDVGKAVAQKLRGESKQFKTTGSGEDMPLYGIWLWGTGGKSVTITEGEIDAMSMSQVFGHRWPVVSLPNGAQSAAKAIGRHLEWLLSFERIVLCFDMDKPGRKAVDEVCKVLPPGRVQVMNLPEKDANDVLVKRGPKALVDAFWQAREWRPDGIVAGEEITVDKIMQAVSRGFPLPYPKANSMLMGLRKGELTLLTAGSGIGKSTLAREWAYLLRMEHGCRIGNVFLEEGNAKTAQGYIAIHTNVPLKDIRADPQRIPRETYESALREVIHGSMFFYDHFGSLESNQLLTKLRYLATVAKVDFIVLDHISIVVSGVESSQGERKDIDVLMTKLRSLVEETGVGIIAICHLSQPDGTPHEEGGRVTLRHLRGSGGLKQLSDNVIALERDQQGDNPTHSVVRILKCRETGETGEADTLKYNRETGRLQLAPMFDTSEPEEAGDGCPF